jgi:lysophospholipase L1-like esterase
MIAKFGHAQETRNDARTNYNSYIRQDQDIASVDVDEVFGGNEDFYQEDHIHFSQSGYVSLTHHVRNRLGDLLRRR